jgi:hypothetical protein
MATVTMSKAAPRGVKSTKVRPPRKGTSVAEGGFPGLRSAEVETGRRNRPVSQLFVERNATATAYRHTK